MESYEIYRSSGHSIKGISKDMGCDPIDSIDSSLPIRKMQTEIVRYSFSSSYEKTVYLIIGEFGCFALYFLEPNILEYPHECPTCTAMGNEETC